MRYLFHKQMQWYAFRVIFENQPIFRIECLPQLGVDEDGPIFKQIIEHRLEGDRSITQCKLSLLHLTRFKLEILAFKWPYPYTLGLQCVADCGLRLFEVRFQMRFAVLVPFKCGLDRGLRFLNVCERGFAWIFMSGCGFR